MFTTENTDKEPSFRDIALWSLLRFQEQEEYKELQYESGVANREERIRELEDLARDRLKERLNNG